MTHMNFDSFESKLAHIRMLHNFFRVPIAVLTALLFLFAAYAYVQYMAIALLNIDCITDYCFGPGEIILMPILPIVLFLSIYPVIKMNKNLYIVGFCSAITITVFMLGVISFAVIDLLQPSQIRPPDTALTDAGIKLSPGTPIGGNNQIGGESFHAIGGIVGSSKAQNNQEQTTANGILVLLYMLSIFSFVFFGIARGALNGPEFRALATELTENWSRFGLFDAIGIPKLIGMNKSRSILILALYIGSAVFSFIYWSILIFVIPGFILGELTLMGEPLKFDLQNFTMLAVLATGIFLLSKLALGQAQKQSIISMDELQVDDPRPPILFLRSFGDDQVAFQKRGRLLMSFLSDITDPPSNLDQELLWEGMFFGPVVALGNPADKVPPYGIARGYVANRNWQQVVSELASEAAAIVICFDDTDSLWWEVEHVLTNSYIEKTLFLLNPKYAESGANSVLVDRLLSHPRLQSHATSVKPVEFEQAAKQTPVLGFFIVDNLAHVGRSTSFSRLAFLAMARWFMRRKLGPDPVPLSTDATRMQTTVTPSRAFVPSETERRPWQNLIKRDSIWKIALVLLCLLAVAMVAERQTENDKNDRLLRLFPLLFSSVTSDNKPQSWQSRIFALGDGLRSAGRYDDALAAYRLVISIVKAETWLPQPDPDREFDLYLSYLRIGQTYLASKKPGDALGVFMKARHHLDRSTAMKPEESKIEKANANLHLHVGDAYWARGEGETALASYRSSLAIHRKLARSKPSDPQLKAALAEGHFAVALALERKDGPEAAVRAYREARRIRTDLVRNHPDSIEWRDALAVVLSHVGAVYVKIGRISDALAAYQEGRDILDELAQDQPEIERFRQGLSHFTEKASELEKRRRKRRGNK